jgi:hypothetical protein
MPSVTVQQVGDVVTQLTNIQKTISALFSQLQSVSVAGPPGPTGATGATGAPGSPGVPSPSGSFTFTGNNTFTPSPQFEAGNGLGLFQPEGALSKQYGAVGNGADTTDDPLFSYTLPANSFDTLGRSLVVDAFGKFATNGNNKTVKLWFGGSVVFTSTAQTLSNQGWWMRLLVMKTASGAQIATGWGQGGSTAFPVPVPLAGTETDTATIVVKVTGASPTTGAANDVVGNCFLVRFVN